MIFYNKYNGASIDLKKTLTDFPLPPINSIEEEVEYIAKTYPGAADTIIQAIKEGDILGADFELCIYGHIVGCNVAECRTLTAIMSYHINENPYAGTFIENLIIDCEEEDTHHNNQALEELYELFQPYCTHSITPQEEIPTHDEE